MSTYPEASPEAYLAYCKVRDNAFRVGRPARVAASLAASAAAQKRTTLASAEEWNDTKHFVAEAEGVTTWDAHDIMATVGYTLSIPEEEAKW